MIEHRIGLELGSSKKKKIQTCLCIQLEHERLRSALLEKFNMSPYPGFPISTGFSSYILSFIYLLVFNGVKAWHLVLKFLFIFFFLYCLK